MFDCFTTNHAATAWFFNGRKKLVNVNTAAKLSFGEKAIANTMVFGKSGTGNTALINFLLSQVQKLEVAQLLWTA